MDVYRQQVLRQETGSGYDKAIGEILATRMDFFNGFGRKQMNEILDANGIPPHIRIDVVFHCDDIYEQLRDYLPDYCQQFDSPEFIAEMCTISKHPNPLAYDYAADAKFNEKWNSIFRLARTKTSIHWFVKLHNAGSLDYAHRYGMPLQH